MPPQLTPDRSTFEPPYNVYCPDVICKAPPGTVCHTASGTEREPHAKREHFAKAHAQVNSAPRRQPTVEAEEIYGRFEPRACCKSFRGFMHAPNCGE